MWVGNRKGMLNLLIFLFCLECMTFVRVDVPPPCCGQGGGHAGMSNAKHLCVSV